MTQHPADVPTSESIMNDPSDAIRSLVETLSDDSTPTRPVVQIAESLYHTWAQLDTETPEPAQIAGIVSIADDITHQSFSCATIADAMEETTTREQVQSAKHQIQTTLQSESDLNIEIRTPESHLDTYAKHVIGLPGGENADKTDIANTATRILDAVREQESTAFIGRSPKGVAATVVWIAIRDGQHMVKQEDIADMAGVSSVTIRNTLSFIESILTAADATRVSRELEAVRAAKVGRDGVSKSHLQDDLDRVIEDLGQIPTRAEYNTHGAYTAGTLARRLGPDGQESYYETLAALGYDVEAVRPRPRGTASTADDADTTTPTTVTAEEVRHDFERVVRELGHVPTPQEYDEHGDCSRNMLVTRFGRDGSHSYYEAVIDLGYDPDPDKRGRINYISISDLRYDLKRVVDELGYVPSETEYDEAGKYTATELVLNATRGTESYDEAVRMLWDDEDVGEQSVMGRVSEQAAYADLEPIIQAFIDHYVRDYSETFPNQIEQRLGLPKGDGRRLVQAFDNQIAARRNAYEQGLLEDHHLNTAPREEFIATERPIAEFSEYYPVEDQPRGTPLDDVISD